MSPRGAAMGRRGVLGLAAAAGLTESLRARPRRSPEGSAAMRVGKLDLRDIPIIDSHVHPVERILLSQNYARQGEAFASHLVPASAAVPADPGRAALVQGFSKLVWEAPRRIGYLNYIARAHRVPATLAAVDGVIAPHIRSDAAFTTYVASIMEREKITGLVLQSAEPEPVRPASLLPDGRWKWTYPIVSLVRPAWARERGAVDLGDVLALIDRTLDQAVSNGCVGFKCFAAYYRPLLFRRETREAAERAAKRVLGAVPSRLGDQGMPIYADDAQNAALRTYEDYLYRHIFIRAARLGRPAIIHSAAALSPAQAIDNNDPRPLYHLLRSDDIALAGTQFIVIHAGYPYHHALAAMASQFPNLHVDTSFFSKYPAALEEIYRTFLAIAPSGKIMHGSDSNAVPEEFGYCAANSRVILARVLADYRSYYGWTAADVDSIARDILHRNAATLLFRTS